MKRISAVAVGLLWTVAGCGGGASGPLDCAWLAGNNCWKQTTSKAMPCLPPANEVGVLSDDNKTCSYAGGTTVTFAVPLTLPVPREGAGSPSPEWNFTVSNGGSACLHFESNSSIFELTVGPHTVSEGRSGPAGLAISCPDGTTYSTRNAVDLLSCGGGASFGGLPGLTYSSSSTSVTFGLLGAASSYPVFSCSK
jgi:hypothetical protein